MLVVVCIDSGVDFGTPALGVLTGIHGVGVQNTRKLDLQLDGAVLVEDPVDTVFIVGGSEDVGDDEFAGTSDDDRVVTEIRVLEQNAIVFFVDAHGVLDGAGRTGAVDKVKVQVVDASLAVTTQAQRVGHVSATIFTQIEGMLALVRVFWVAIRDDHFGQRKSVKDWSNHTFGLVKEADVVENDALAVVEANMNGPVLPFNCSTLHGEADAFWLGDVDRLEVSPESTTLFYGFDVVVVWRCPAERSSDLGNIDMNDFLLVGVVDGTEVQGE